MSLIRVLFLLVLFVSTLAAQQEETLFSINGEPVSVSEFKYIYEKNNRDQADYSEKSIEEYLELYINFKLKVHKARELKYDESDTYQQELAGYRLQLADSYVIDREVISRMVDEIHQRHQMDIELNHILLSFDRKGPPAKRIEAYNKAQKVKKELDEGKPFEQAVVQYSQDRNSAAIGGYIGFINAPLPDGYVALEDAAYALEVGQLSDPIRTDLGYHIIQVVSKRPARGVMEGKHLLIRKERNGIKLADAEPRINRIYESIQSGAKTFEEATIISSEDKDTKGNSGSLGFFGIGQYDKDFEDAAFALQNNGDISKPVETSIGWHIIKRVSKKDLDSKEVIKNRIKGRPKSGERFDIVTTEVVNSIKKEASFKEDRKQLDRLKDELQADFFSYNWKVQKYEEKDLISFGTDTYQLNDFTEFAKKNNKLRMRAKGVKSVSEAVDELYDLFIREKAISFAESRLEERYPEFKNLMREYREGILLFDLTKDLVWDKASKDTSEIRAFYNDHKSDYVWEDRADVTHYTISSTDPTLVTKILNDSRNKTTKELTDLYNTQKELIFFRQETLESSHEELQGMTLKKNQVSAPKFKKSLKVTTFKKIDNVTPSRQKTLKEARGYIISDYQELLDQQWISQLNKENNVKINKKVLKKLIQK